LPKVRLRIEGKTLKDVNPDFRDFYQAEVDTYLRALNTKGFPTSFRTLPQTRFLEIYPTGDTPEQISEWTKFKFTRQMIFTATLDYLYGFGQAKAKEFLFQSWPEAEVQRIWAAILETYNNFPPMTDSPKSYSSNVQLPNPSPTPARPPSSGHPDLRDAVGCLGTGCYIKPSVLNALESRSASNQTLVCASRLSDILNGRASSGALVQWLLSQGTAAGDANRTVAELRIVETHIDIEKTAVFRSIEDAKDMLSRLLREVDSFQERLQSLRLMREVCGRIPPQSRTLYSFAVAIGDARREMAHRPCSEKPSARALATH
jgi:hypothetical protein